MSGIHILYIFNKLACTIQKTQSKQPLPSSGFFVCVLEQLILKEENAKGKALVILTKTIYEFSKGKIREELSCKCAKIVPSIFLFIDCEGGKKRRKKRRKKEKKLQSHSQSSLHSGNIFIFLIFFFPPDLRQDNYIC